MQATLFDVLMQSFLSTLDVTVPALVVREDLTDYSPIICDGASMEAVIQSEVAECGLACLAMISSCHGRPQELRELRRRFPVSMNGMSLGQLTEVANAIGLNSRAVRLEVNEVHDLALPCILHWDLNHFVVLTRAGRRGVELLDPAEGRRFLRLDELSAHFTGVAVELLPCTDFKPVRPPPALGVMQLIGGVPGLGRAFATILVLSLALQTFVLLTPLFMQGVVDHVLIAADQDLLTVLSVGFGLALLIQVFVGVVRGWAIIHLSSSLSLQWTGSVFSHMLRLPLDFFEKRHVGDIRSRMESVKAIQRTLTTSFVEVLIDGVIGVVALGMMILYSGKLVLVTLMAVSAYLMLRALAFRTVQRGNELYLIAEAKEESHLLESIRGLQSIKVAAREGVRRSVYQNLIADSVGKEARLSRLSLSFGAASQVIFGLERIAAISIGAALSMQGIFSVGMLVAYLAYKDQFAARVAGLIDKWVEFRMLRLHCDRLSDIVLAEPESVAESPCTFELPGNPGISLEGVWFRHSPGDPWILRGCSFVVDPGESVVIVGGSGCGKTTLMKLMLGLLTPTEGVVRVGGVPLGAIGNEAYRHMTSAVMQDDLLFAGTIAENIAFDSEAVDPMRVQEAAERAAVHEDIVAMPMGYHSVVGDMGSSLSGGQRQRLILARALYRNPRILFLDEATSHLDVERERRVNDAVRHLPLTRITIAHRPETIRSADRVLTMHDGVVVEGHPAMASTRCGSSGE